MLLPFCRFFPDGGNPVIVTVDILPAGVNEKSEFDPVEAAAPEVALKLNVSRLEDVLVFSAPPAAPAVSAAPPPAAADPPTAGDEDPRPESLRSLEVFIWILFEYLLTLLILKRLFLPYSA